ncbi:DUF1351 domain-containing protein [Blautia coccoides]|uniref:DUF1351 domain-containing protein n=1 Tax=Blautia producta TaxID=33035 RepID=UPI0028A3E5DF|nr:DUF1351 domain-containing protein [Blautia coccoides]MDT4373978.1 DUF1351 domain-containing protein [Blautia coccoides]
MELKITTPMAPGILPEVQWNNEELRKDVAGKAEEYKNTAYTAEQLPEMRKDRAKLNALVTAFEDQRKQVKKFYNTPYDKFEKEVKEVLAPVRDAITLIDKGIAEVEKKYREDRKAKMQEMYEKYVGDLRGLVPFTRTVKEEYYKKAFTDKKLEQAYIDFFGRIREDMKALEELPERYRDKALLKYVESFSLSDALREGKRLEELEKAMEERRRNQEAEKAARDAAKQREELQARPQAQAQQQEAPITETVNTANEEEPIISLDFRAWGTKAQLMGLRQYMIDNHIKFGKVE